MYEPFFFVQNYKENTKTKHETINEIYKNMKSLAIKNVSNEFQTQSFGYVENRYNEGERIRFVHYKQLWIVI